jgi:hypothetical protein
LKGFSGAETEDINDKLNDAFDDPKVLGDIDKLINADVEKNSDKYATDMAGRLLKEAVNPATGQLESERIREITASLKNFRNLGPSARSLSDLEGGCNSIVWISFFLEYQRWLGGETPRSQMLPHLLEKAPLRFSCPSDSYFPWMLWQRMDLYTLPSAQSST